MSAVLEARTHGRLRVLRMNRPERKNALDRSLIETLHRAFHDAASDDDVWAILLTGNGDAFCSGLDFSDQTTVGAAPASDEDRPPPGRNGGLPHLTVVMQVECEKPILAGVNGVAVGAGVSLALNADIRIAAPSARFHPGYSRLGLSPDLGLSWTLPRAIGYERALRFLLEQRMVERERSARARPRQRGRRAGRGPRRTAPRLRHDARERRAHRGASDEAPHGPSRPTA